MYSSSKEVADKMDIIKNKNDNDIELTEEEEQFQETIVKEIMQIAFKTKHQGVEQQDSKFFNSYRNRKERKRYTVDKIDFEKCEQFINEILEDCASSIKLASKDSKEKLVIDNLSAISILHNTLISLEKQDYENYKLNVKKLKEFQEEPRFEKVHDLFQITLRSLEKIMHLNSNDVKDFDKLIGGVFQTYKYSMGKNLIDTKEEKPVFGLSSLKEDVQKELMQMVRDLFSKAAQKCLTNTYYFTEEK